MHPAIRTQNEPNQEFYSDLSAVTMDTPDTARQEFKADADINNIIKRFGIDTLANPRPPIYTETNFDQDLQQAITNINETRIAWQKLPQHLKAKYPDWQSLLNAIDSGELTKLDPPPEPEETAAPPS